MSANRIRGSLRRFRSGVLCRALPTSNSFLHPLGNETSTVRATTALSVAAVYLAAVLPVLYAHELWLDEWQAWQIALDSGSLAELWKNTHLESSPKLWHLLLFLITRFTDQVWAMQAFHILIAAAVVFVFVRYAPFPFPLKVLFSFSYYPFYEYAVITRSYGLGLLLAFSFCALFLSPVRRGALSALVLLLLSQTSLHGAFLAAGFAPMFLWRLVDDGPKGRYWKLKTAMLVGTVAAGLIVAVLQSLPPSDTPDSAALTQFSLTLDKLLEVAGVFHNSYLPFPSLEGTFWNTNFLSSTALRVLSSALLLAFTLGLLARRPFVLFCCYLPPVIFILALGTIWYSFFIRHYGLLFIMLICSLWILARFPPHVSNFPPLDWFRAKAWRLRWVFLYSVLAVQVAAASYAAWYDWGRPFNAARETADFIRKHGWQDSPIAGDHDFLASSVAGYLNRSIFYPRSKRTGTFIPWDAERKKPISEAEILNRVYGFAREQQATVTVVFDYQVSTLSPLLRPAFVSEQGTIWLYRVGHRPRPVAAPKYRLGRDGRVSRLSSGRPLRRGKTLGMVEFSRALEDSVVLAGWALDTDPVQSVRKIVVMLNEQPVFEFKPYVNRPDWARYYDRKKFRVGFRILLPVRFEPKEQRPRIRLFAISRREEVRELTYHPGYQWGASYGTFSNVAFESCLNGNVCTFSIPGVHALLGERVLVELRGALPPEFRDRCAEEISQDHSAAEFVRGLLAGARRIDLVDIQRTDRFGIRANVVADNLDVGQALINQGWCAVPP